MAVKVAELQDEELAKEYLGRFKGMVATKGSIMQTGCTARAC